MRRPFLTFFLAIFFLTFPLSPIAQESRPAREVHFSPHGGAAEAIIREGDKARKTMLVQIFTKQEFLDMVNAADLERKKSIKCQ